MTASERFIFTFFNWEIDRTYLPSIAEGFLLTVVIAICIVISGIAFGAVLAVIRSSGIRIVNFLIVVFVDIFRAIPPLVFILIFYFGLPSIGINMSSFTVTWLCLSLVLGAFAEEIFRAGIMAVSRGQWEAARSTGLSQLRTLIYVVMPQAIRLTIPPLTNRTIAITKMTALGSVIGFGEILSQSTTAVSFSGNPSPLVLGAFAYLILFLPVVIAGRWIETRFAWKRQ
jgi:polar amino acid transport system permease protein